MSVDLYNTHNRARLKCTRFEVALSKFFRCVRPLIGGTAAATPGNVLLALIVLSVACHKVLTYALFYPIFRMVFGTLYPAYASYKAVRSRNVREYVKWMMYWIVFAIFSCIETFTDIFLSWFPFYYELKILMVIWLLAPATKGSSILYRKFVHPTLSNKEQEIDEYITKAKEQSYKQVLDLGTRGVSAIMQTAIKSGGGLVNQIKKSYSLSDLTDCNMDEQDGGELMEREQPRLSRHSRPRRAGGPSSNTASTNAAMYYSQLDIRADSLDSIPSEDLSSGYSSGDANLAALHQQQQTLGRSRGESLQRTASLTRAKPTRVTRSTGVTIVRKGSTTTAEDVSEAHTETESPSSASDEDFQDTLDGNAGENGSYVPSVSALANHGIVMTQSSENYVLSPSNNTPLNNNADSDTINPSVSLGEVDNVSVQTGDSVQHHDIMNEVEDKRGNTVRSKLEEITNVLEDIESLKSQFDLEDTRAGKYHKRHAPAIPEASAIIAKLVLKPGVLKPLTNPEDCSVSQVFCHSPKFRRRSRGGSSKSPSGSCSRSRSRSSSPCPPPTKTDTSLMKLAVLQKKLFGKDGKMNDLFHPNKRDHQHDNDLD